MGRFINSDSLRYLGDGAELSNCNLFVYCGNNPVNMIDPEGKSALAILIFIGVSTLAGGLTGALISASTDGNVLEGAIEGAILACIASSLTVLVPYFWKGASKLVTTLVTCATSGAAGMAIDAIIQKCFNRLGGDADKEIDMKRVFKAGFTTALASIIPTIGTPNECLINSIGSAIIGFDASFINAVIEIIIVNLFDW